MRELAIAGPAATKRTIKSLYHDIDCKQTRPLDFRKLNADSPGLPTTLVQSIETNYDEATAILKAATERYNEFNTGVNLVEDDGDRRHDKREVIYGLRVVTGDGLQVSYDRMRAEAEVKHWREYLNWASARDSGKGYVKP